MELTYNFKVFDCVLRSNDMVAFTLLSKDTQYAYNSDIFCQDKWLRKLGFNFSNPTGLRGKFITIKFTIHPVPTKREGRKIILRMYELDSYCMRISYLKKEVQSSYSYFETPPWVFKSNDSKIILISAYENNIAEAKFELPLREKQRMEILKLGFVYFRIESIMDRSHK